jgi:hypothetical protein
MDSKIDGTMLDVAAEMVGATDTELLVRLLITIRERVKKMARQE